MPLQNFISRRLPAISAAWLNAVDRLKFTVFEDASAKDTAVTALFNSTAAKNAGMVSLELRSQIVSTGTDSGIVNAAVVTLNGPLIAWSRVTGSKVAFTAAVTNTGATTLNVNGTGVAAVLASDGSACTGGELSLPVTVEWTGAVWRIIGGSIPLGYRRTSFETTAGFSPSNYGFLPGDIRRMGAATTESAANNTTAIQRTIDVAEIGGPAVYIPAGTFAVTQLTVDTTNAITIYGDGYHSVLQGALNGTQIILFVQKAGFTALNGLRLQNFRVDANGGGQLDAGAVQINNAIGFVLEQIWVENATRVSGVSGVGGIVVSVGSPGATGPIGTLHACYVRNTSKAGINITSEDVGVVVDSCVIRDITGNGTAPGIQVNGAFGSRIVNNLIFNTQGRGIYLATDSLGNAPRDTVVANNVIHDTGTGTSEGDCIALTRSFGSPTGRVVIANNRLYNAGVGMNAYGIYLTSDDNVTVVGNHVSACKLYGLRVQNCNDILISGNTFDSNNTSNTALTAGIYIDGTCSRVTVVGNISGGGNQAYGLECAASATLTKFHIADNNFYGNGTLSVAFNSTPKQSTISVVVERQTTDGSASTALAFVLPDNTTMSVNFKSTAEQSGAGNRAYYHSDGLFYRAGGGATVQGAISNLTTIESDATWGGNAIGVSGNSAIVQVQGLGATTINWDTEIVAITS